MILTSTRVPIFTIRLPKVSTRRVLVFVSALVHAYIILVYYIRIYFPYTVLLSVWLAVNIWTNLDIWILMSGTTY